MTSVWLASRLNLRSEFATVAKSKTKDINVYVVEQPADEDPQPRWMELLLESGDAQ